MKRSLILFELITILDLTTHRVVSQSSSLSNYGSEFFVGFMRHPPGDGQLHLQLHLLTQASSPVQFQIQSSTGDYNHTGTTTVGSAPVVNIPEEFHTWSNTYSHRHNGLYVATLETEPVAVLAYSWRDSDYMAYSAWPCHEQPTIKYVYHVVSLLSVAETHENDTSVSEFLLVGCRDNTSVTITPSRDLKLPSDPQVQGSPNVTITTGTSRSFTLHRLQTLLVAEAGVDLSGTEIASNKPLTILSGHEIAQVPLGVKDGDPVITQLTPTIAWGNRFMIPTDDDPSTSGRLLKLTASHNDTTVDLQCGNDAHTTTVAMEMAGSSHTVPLNASDYCGAVANKPIHVAMFGHSSNNHNDNDGDPYLITIPPLEQYVQTAQVSTASDLVAGQSLSLIVTIIMPENSFTTESVVLGNSSLLSPKKWTQIHFPNGTLAGYGFTYHHSNSEETIAHPNKHGTIFVSAYGYRDGSRAALAYCAGAMQYPIATTTILPEISFTLLEYTAKEMEGGEVMITLERSKKFDGNVVVHFETSPHLVDTATAGEDYKHVSMEITFQPEEVTKEVMVAIGNDQYAEPVEHFTVRIEVVEGGVAFPITEAIVNINDDDSVIIEITNNDISLESGQVSVSTDVTKGTLQHDQEVVVDLTLEVLGVATLPAVPLQFKQPTRGFITRLDLPSLKAGQIPVIRAALKTTEAKVALEIGGSTLITPTANTVPSNSPASVLATPTIPATNCSQTGSGLVADCVVLIYMATGLLVGILAIGITATLIGCRLCYQIGKNRHQGKRHRHSRKGTMKNRPLPNIPANHTYMYTTNPTYNIRQEDPTIQTGTDDDKNDNHGHDDQNHDNSDGVGESGKEDSDKEMTNNLMYNHQQHNHNPFFFDLDPDGSSPPQPVSTEPSDFEYNYPQEGARLSLRLAHQDGSWVDASDTQPLITVNDKLSNESDTTANKSTSLATEEKSLGTEKCPQGSQNLPAKLLYQNVGRHNKKGKVVAKYQNVGSRGNGGQRTAQGHQRKPHYGNIGKGQRRLADETAVEKERHSRNKPKRNVDSNYTLLGHPQLAQDEAIFQEIGSKTPESQQGYENVASPTCRNEEMRGNHHHSDSDSDDDFTQAWPSSAGAMQSDEPSLSGYQATYDLLMHHLDTSDDQQSSASDY